MAADRLRNQALHATATARTTARTTRHRIAAALSGAMVLAGLGVARAEPAAPPVPPPRPPSFAAPVPQQSAAAPAAAAGGERARFLALIARQAGIEGMPAEVAQAVAHVESGYNPGVIGGVGEIGLMQVRPGTAAMLGFRGTAEDLAVPETNVRYGVRYLAQAWRLADGDLCRALMKYRAGHGSEFMSPLSVTYCARARAYLSGSSLVASLPGTGRVPTFVARREPLGALAALAATRGLKRGSADFQRVFWSRREAQIRKLREQVQAGWRARGWRPT
jgi:soluble lytic murein transglycosylase-like protein